MKAFLVVGEGDLARGADAIGDSITYARTHHLRTVEVNAHAIAAALHLGQDDMTGYRDSLEASQGVGMGSLVAASKARAERRAADALAAVPAPDNSIVEGFWALYWAERACSLAMLGERRQAEVEFDKFWSLVTAEDHLFWAHQSAVAVAADALPLIDRAGAAAVLYEMHLSSSQICPLPLVSHARASGDLAFLANRMDAARGHFAAGLEVCEREQMPVEAGRCHLGLARVALAIGDPSASLDHLEAAAQPFRRCGATFFLDQVVELKVQIQGITSDDMQSSIVALNRSVQSEHPDIASHAAPDGTVTIMFSDIENSVPLNERLGDAKYVELLRAHNAIIEAQVQAHHGYVVKTMGDGYMVAFKSAADGLKCAIAIQRAILGMEDGVRVRIGLHTGEMVREGDDFFGRHVNLAARVAGHASGGEIFVSGVVRELVSGQSFVFEDLGDRPMKGFEQPTRVWSVRWQS